MGQRLSLGVLGIGEQRGGGGMRRGEAVGAEAGQAGHLELGAELALAERGVELPGRPVGDRGARLGERRRNVVAVDQHLGRGQPAEPAGQVALGAFGESEPAAAHRQPGQADRRSLPGDGEQRRIAAVAEQRPVGERAGRDDADHLALDRPLGARCVADLLADRDRLAEPDQPRQVGVDRMRRHAGHRDRLAAGLAACGQRDVEQPVRPPRIVEEQLVEVAHPVEEERVGMGGLDAQVLLHDRRVVGRILAGSALLGRRR